MPQKWGFPNEVLRVSELKHFLWLLVIFDDSLEIVGLDLAISGVGLSHCTQLRTMIKPDAGRSERLSLHMSAVADLWSMSPVGFS